MSKPKPSHTVRYKIRLGQTREVRCFLEAQLDSTSDNEVFDYLVRLTISQREDLEQLVYSLFGNLADSLARRFQSLETVTQLHLAMTDTFVKYALTAGPEASPRLMAESGHGQPELDTESALMQSSTYARSGFKMLKSEVRGYCEGAAELNREEA